MFVIKLRGTRSVFWLALLSIFFGLALLPPTCFAQDVAVTMFGPKQYLRTTASVDTFTDSFNGVPGNGTVIIQNGDGNGHNLVEDLLIEINGVPLADWSALLQPGYKLEAPISMSANNSILVILMGKPGSYLTIEAQAEITPDATTTDVIGIGGGTMSVQNHLGDTFTLQIPPLALGEDTSISISSLPNALPSPIANSAYPGAVLEPEGLFFISPVSMSVTLHGAPQNSNPAMMFWLEDTNHVLAIGNQTTTPNSVAGQNYHFSTEIGAFPTPPELADNVAQLAAGGQGMPTNPEDQIVALVSIAAYASQEIPVDPNFGPVAESAWSSAWTVATNWAKTELNAALPADPCGLKATANMAELFTVLQSLTLDQTANEILLARGCSLSLDPSKVSLFVGQTWDHEITATLTDPKSKKRSCSAHWYNPNPAVATIATSGNACVPTGVAPGIATVSAVCDGLNSNSAFSNSTEVTVCGLIGTYQGTYSGETFTRGGKPKPISGTIAVPFTQNGTSVSADIMGYTFTGTNINGKVILEAMVPCYASTRLCLAGINGKLSSDCSTFSGSFYADKRRALSGTFSVQLTTP